MKTKKKKEPKELKIVIGKSSGKFGEGFTIWINGRWILDASTFSRDLKIRIDNYRCKRIVETTGRYGHDIYKFDKRKTK